MDTIRALSRAGSGAPASRPLPLKLACSIILPMPLQKFCCLIQYELKAATLYREGHWIQETCSGSRIIWICQMCRNCSRCSFTRAWRSACLSATSPRSVGLLSCMSFPVLRVSLTTSDGPCCSCRALPCNLMEQLGTDVSQLSHASPALVTARLPRCPALSSLCKRGTVGVGVLGG